MTSRATAIAERIRRMAEPVSPDNASDPFVVGYNHAVKHGVPRMILRGGIDHLLGPEPTAEVLEWLRDAQEECWSDARSFARAGRTSRNPRGSFDECMKYRRLAKWMRKLERSCK